MEVGKIRTVFVQYRAFLAQKGVKARRIDPQKTFTECTHDEVLAHALHLVELSEHIDGQDQYGKLNRHLTAVQMCLSFTGQFTLNELMEHNKP